MSSKIEGHKILRVSLKIISVEAKGWHQHIIMLPFLWVIKTK